MRTDGLANYSVSIHTTLVQAAALFAFVLASSAPAIAQDATATRNVDSPRLRIGVDCAAGIGLAERADDWDGVSPAFHTAASMRLGVQIDRRWAAYYEASGVLATFGGCPGDDCGLVSGAMHVSSAVVEATIFDGLPIALGPSLAWGVMQEHGKPSWGGGGVARIGWTFGGAGTGTRQGLSLSMRMSVVYLGPRDALQERPGEGLVVVQRDGGVVASITIGVGWESF